MPSSSHEDRFEMAVTPSGAARSTPGLAPALTPHGRLRLVPDDAPALAPELRRGCRRPSPAAPATGCCSSAPARSARRCPPSSLIGESWAPSSSTPSAPTPDDSPGARAGEAPAPPREQLQALAAAAPPMTGAEYLTAAVLESLWEEMAAAFHDERSRSGLGAQDLLRRFSPAWNLVGRVHFNLAENRKDDEAPFAFLATYTGRLSAHGKAQHLPLGQALREYAGEAKRERLLSLLLPVQRAGETLPLAQGDGRRRRDLPPAALDARARPSSSSATSRGSRRRASWCACPAAWRGNRPPRPQVTATVGGKPPSGLGTDALLDFRMEVTLDGERLTRGRDRAAARRHGRAGARPRAVGRGRPRQAAAGCSTSSGGRSASPPRRASASRRRCGCWPARDVAKATAEAAAADPDWSRVVAGPWLAETLEGAAEPRGARARASPGAPCRATLRPYQEVGVRWLYLLSQARPRRLPRRRHGPRQDASRCSRCSLVLKARGAERQSVPSLLVAPGVASRQLGLRGRALRAGAARPRRPSLRHARRRAEGASAAAARRRRPRRHELRLRCCGSPGSQSDALATSSSSTRRRRSRTRAPSRRGRRRSSTARARIALTGTPVENRLSDLWSIFDFVEPGAARLGPGVHRLRQAPRREAAQPVRAAARAGAPVHPAAAQDRPVGHLRPARQDRGQGLLRAQPQAGGALPGGGEGAGRAARGHVGDRAQGADPVLPDALQADLQPPVAVAGRLRLGRGGQRQARQAARDRRGHRRPAGEGARLHAVPRGDRAARRASSGRSSGAQGLVLHGGDPGRGSARSW